MRPRARQHKSINLAITISHSEEQSPSALSHGIFVKLLPTSHESDTLKRSEGLRNQNTSLQRFKHPNLLSSLYLDARPFPQGPPIILSPKLEQGNIRNYLENNPGADVFSKICAVADTLGYLHNNGVVHGNLKPNNILINDNGSIVLSDFGLSHIIDPCGSEKGLESVRYAAPELIDASTQLRTYKSDVYAFASVSVEILTGSKPYDHIKSDVEVVLALYHQELPFSPPHFSLLGHPGFDMVFWELMTNCWSGNPDSRPDIFHVCDMLKHISSALTSENKSGTHRSYM